MTRNLTALVSRTLRTDRNRTARPRRRNAGLTLESLEVRLALSSVPAAPVPLDLNPQPLPPGVVRRWDVVAPDIQGNHIGTNVSVLTAPVPLDLNPQPLPPGVVRKLNPVAPDGIQGNHIGTAATVAPDGIQGNHIGSPAIVGNHIGSPAIVGNHIGTSVVTPSIIAIL